MKAKAFRTNGDGEARTPEELETLLEDALLTRDAVAVAALFEADGTLAADPGRPVRGAAAIARTALAAWSDGRTYVADPRQVVVARDVALVVAAGGANVARRGPDGTWRFAIVFHVIDGDYGEERAMLRTQERQTAPDTERSNELAPAAVAAGAGEARWWLGSLAVIKATAADTGGQFTIVDVTNPPNDEAPLHVHHREDEAFWILEGDATFEVGGETIEARAGDYLFGPRGVPHRYRVGPAGCRMLFILTPGGFERLVVEMSEPAASRTLPPPMTEEPDWERVAAVAAANGCELLD